MPHTCSSCGHWKRNPARPDSPDLNVGQCHAGPPAADYRWPRSMGTDWCSGHTATAVAVSPARQVRPPNRQSKLLLG